MKISLPLLMVFFFSFLRFYFSQTRGEQIISLVGDPCSVNVTVFLGILLTCANGKRASLQITGAWEGVETLG